MLQNTFCFLGQQNTVCFLDGLKTTVCLVDGEQRTIRMLNGQQSTVCCLLCKVMLANFIVVVSALHILTSGLSSGFSVNASCKLPAADIYW